MILGKIILPLLLLLPSLLAAQIPSIPNPSFEGPTGAGQVPPGWQDIGFRFQSPPDTGPTEQFRSAIMPSHGQSHLVMITRPNGTWERVRVQPSTPLKTGQCYSFWIDLASSPTYLSVSRQVDQMVNFNHPTMLRVWGLDLITGRELLLAYSVAIDHEDWRSYQFEITPPFTCTHLQLEAYYPISSSTTTAGNLHVDHLRAFQACDLFDDVHGVSAERLTTEAQRRLPAATPKLAADNTIEFDTTSVNAALVHLSAGRLDMGLYQLAEQQRASKHNKPWTIRVRTDSSVHPNLQIKIIRRRIKALQLRQQLSVAAAPANQVNTIELFMAS